MNNGFKHDHLYYITKKTKEHNIDNVSRTKAYQNFYLCHPEIKWAFLASMVSRNAGWNMTDLYLPPYQDLLNNNERTRLFMMYERANWLIFSDAYPQLLVYQLSVKKGKALFDVLRHFNVSHYMITEWKFFWERRDEERLLVALIINEQHVIQKPVIDQSFFKRNVFWQLPYVLQNMAHLNAVLLPTKTGKIYGKFVFGFAKVKNRIQLGKEIAAILFCPRLFHSFLDFALYAEHTGSRRDYERFLSRQLPKSPFLRTVYPIIEHRDPIRKDWYKNKGLPNAWLKPLLCSDIKEIGPSFYRKRELLYSYYHFKNFLINR